MQQVCLAQTRHAHQQNVDLSDRDFVDIFVSLCSDISAKMRGRSDLCTNIFYNEIIRVSEQPRSP